MGIRKSGIKGIEKLLGEIASEPPLLRKGEYILSHNEMKLFQRLRDLKKKDYEIYTRYHLEYIKIQNFKITGERDEFR